MTTRCSLCGSYAINLHQEGIDQGSLCDIHYYKAKYEEALALLLVKQLAISVLEDQNRTLLYPAQPMPDDLTKRMYDRIALRTDSKAFSSFNWFYAGCVTASNWNELVKLPPVPPVPPAYFKPQ